MVRFMPQPLYPKINNPLYPLDRRLGGLQSRSKCYEEDKNFLNLLGKESGFIDYPARRLAAVPTELSRLPHRTKYGRKLYEQRQ
jgi:hypothetical protein